MASGRNVSTAIRPPPAKTASASEAGDRGLPAGPEDQRGQQHRAEHRRSRWSAGPGAGPRARAGPPRRGRPCRSRPVGWPAPACAFSSRVCKRMLRWIGPSWLSRSSEPSGGISTDVSPCSDGVNVSWAWNGPMSWVVVPPSHMPSSAPIRITATSGEPSAGRSASAGASELRARGAPGGVVPPRGGPRGAALGGAPRPVRRRNGELNSCRSPRCRRSAAGSGRRRAWVCLARPCWTW